MDNNKLIDIRNLVELEKYEEDWNTLIEKCHGSVHTQSYAWIQAFLRYSLLPDERWICLFAYESRQLVAVYPLIINRRIGFSGLYFQTFRTPYNIYHTIRVDGLILPGHENILELIVNHLRKSFKAFPIIQISGIPDFSPSMLYFNLKNKNLALYKKYNRTESYITLHENHQIYLSGLKGKFKKDINRRLRRLNSLTGVSFLLRNSQKTNEENLELFKEIESSGWKGDRKVAIKTRAGDSELYLSATNKFHEKGWVHWNFLEVNNETIAAKLFVRINNTTVSWKTAYREDYSTYGPGKLLFYKCIEDFYARGELGEINFMDVIDWFKDWNISTRPLFTIIIFPRSSILAPIIKLFLRIKYR
jgi:hypothetical protein